MRPQSTTSASATPLAEIVQDYTERGWTIAETADGVCLITDEDVSGVEVTGELAATVRTYLQANDLDGPIIEHPGVERREIHLVTGIRRAAAAVAALREAGATVHTRGAGDPLPPSRISAESATWSVAPADARWTPPLVALSAAVRAATSNRRPQPAG